MLVVVVTILAGKADGKKCLMPSHDHQSLAWSHYNYCDQQSVYFEFLMLAVVTLP